MPAALVHEEVHLQLGLSNLVSARGGEELVSTPKKGTVGIVNSLFFEMLDYEGLGLRLGGFEEFMAVIACPRSHHIPECRLSLFRGLLLFVRGQPALVASKRVHDHNLYVIINSIPALQIDEVASTHCRPPR